LVSLKRTKHVDESEEEIVSKYVDEYIDGLRMDVIGLDGSRVITEQSDSRIVIVDKDFLIDKSKEYEVVLRNPVEDYFLFQKKSTTTKLKSIWILIAKMDSR